jgi:paraquat-inducible protein B
MKTPVAKKKKSIIFLAWLMPIVAIIISYGLLQEYYDKNGKQVTIYVDDIKGLNLRKSHVEYRGVKIGDLVGIEPDKENINRFKIDVTIYKNFDYMIKDGSKFWIVSPQVSIDKIDNIGAVLTGDYIETLPPSEDISKLKALKDKYIFTAEVQKPLQKGKTIELLSNDGAISNGAKVLYKGIVVGEIYSKELQKNSNINYGILIYNKYKELLTNSSLFFKNTPVDFKISATDLNLKVPPIKHFITGSISFINDHKLINKDKNYLYDSKEELYYNDDIYILKLSENQEFKYIYYNSEKVAKVVESKYNTKSDTKTLYIKFKDKYKYILQKSPSFYIQKSKLDIENIDIKGMITGDKLIVNIDSTKYTKPKKEYKAKVYNIKDIQKGKKIKIASDSISTGQKIYYKGIEIGYVSRVYLQDMQKISEVIIYKKYKNLINSSSMFYKINDINTKLSLDGLKVEVASIKQIFYGGISFETLDKSAKHSNKIYSLYDSYDDMRDDIESKKYFYITITAQDAYNIKSTSKLYYKNISIADVESIELNSDISIKLKVDNRYKSLFGGYKNISR